MRPQTIPFTQFLNVLLFLTVILLITTPAQEVVSAQEDLPLWRQNLDCGEKEDQKHLGVEYCNSSIGYHDGKSGTPLDGTVKAHVVIVDLLSPGIKFEYMIAEGVIGKKDATKVAECTEDKIKEEGIVECIDVNRSTKDLGGPGCNDPENEFLYPLMDLERAVERARNINPSTAFVITSDYGARTGGDRDHGPEGLTVVRGCRLDGPSQGDGDNNAVKRPWLAFSENPAEHAEFHQLRSDLGAKPYPWIYTGVGGAPRLILNGIVLEANINNCLEADPASCRDGASQVAVGISRDNRWLFLVLAEAPPVGANLLIELAVFMREQMDVWQAIKFDGGGSSQLWYKGDSVSGSIVYREERRSLSQYLALTAEPGDGIDVPRPDEIIPVTSGDEPEESQLARLLEQIQTALNEVVRWFQELPTLLGRLLDQAMNRVIEQVTSWAEKKIQEFVEQTLSQCCVGLALPVGVVILAAGWKRRKRANR